MDWWNRSLARRICRHLHRGVAQAIADIWASSGDNVMPIVQLCGDDPQSKRDIAAAACAQVGLDLHAASAHLLPSNPAEFDAFLRLWQREAILTGSGLIIESSQNDGADAARQRSTPNARTVAGRGACKRWFAPASGSAIDCHARRRQAYAAGTTRHVGELPGRARFHFEWLDRHNKFAIQLRRRTDSQCLRDFRLC